MADEVRTSPVGSSEYVDATDSSEWRKFKEGVEKENEQKRIKMEMDKLKESKKKFSKPMKGGDWVKFIILVVIALLFLVPIVLVIVNSFKSKNFILEDAFAFPNESNLPRDVDTNEIVVFGNYIWGMDDIHFLPSFINSLIVTVGSVLVLVLATSMCAWYITRVKTWYTKLMYLLFACSMIVPFQMVMYPLAYITNQLHLDSIWGIIVIYLGFGAGLSVFMFAGFVKSVPLEIEEAAMIDGCGTIRTFFRIVFPIMKPSAITVAILNAMWIWNDYLLPYLVLPKNDPNGLTLPVALQALRGTRGSIIMDKMMAMVVLAIIPVIIFYFACQKYIIKGVVAGAVKG